MKKFILKLVSDNMERPWKQKPGPSSYTRESNWSKATRGMDPERDKIIDKATGRPPLRPKVESKTKSEDKKEDKDAAA